MKARWVEKALLTLLGPDGYLRLTETNGGTFIHIPKRAAGTRLAQEIGNEAAEKLASQFGGQHIEVPLARAFRVAHYEKSGKSHRWIALKIGMTESGLRRLIRESNEGKRPNNQIDLFSS